MFHGAGFRGAMTRFNEAAGFTQRKLLTCWLLSTLMMGFNEAAGFTQRKPLNEMFSSALNAVLQ